jgi:primosomal protein N' (replication factor Y) (superfamily II helicase)
MTGTGAPSEQGGLFASPEAATPAGDLRLVRVVVERGIEGRGGRESGLTYIDAGLGLGVGDRVEVPLNRGNEKAGGIVVAAGGAELLDGLAASKLKSVAGRQDGRLGPGLVALGRWMSEYYVCPLGMVFATMLPAAVKRGPGGRLKKYLERGELDAIDGAAVKPTVRAVLEIVRGLDESTFPIEARALALVVGAKNLGPIRKLVELGALREVVRRVRVGVNESSFGDVLPEGDSASKTLTPDQAAAVDGIGAALGGFGVHLLRGVTGSGKTEVYLRLIRRVLDGDPGAGAIVLVPEIALTPQTSERFRARFAGEGVVTLHSGLSNSQRQAAWASLEAGKARVVVGARSAVFAPLARVGLIVVDEEHDASYKQDQLPRYSARDAAVKRAQLEGCAVVLGSATPSLESWANAVGPRPKFSLWELKSRAGGGRLPRVEIVDLGKEMEADPAMRAGAMLGPRLTGAVGATLRAGGQVILLLNRRGYASVVGCASRTCGWTLKCDYCSTAMVFHKDPMLTRGGLVRCHHCQAERIRPDVCPDCGTRARSFGAGTQRAEEEIESKFGKHVLGEAGVELETSFARVDSDSMRSAADYFAVLSRFARGELRLLLGTQLISKGLDFPGVRLVGVVNADTGLWMPDFRAGERTFQLVSQVAGRAGRGEEPGRVLVQTLSPESIPITCAAAHDYRGFADQELEVRAATGLPPAARMARIVCRDRDSQAAREAAEALSAALSDAAARLGEGVDVSPAAPCVIERVSEHWRFEVRIVARRAGIVQRVLADVRRQGLLKSDATTAVDVDPVSMM